MSISYSIRHAIHPEDVKAYDTTKLRKSFLVETLFSNDNIELIYTHYDRFIVGGIKPVSKSLLLESIPPLRAAYFLERRELGIINVGKKSKVTADGQDYILDYKEALYLGKGVKEVVFHPSAEGQALFYINSTPAHATYPSKKVSLAEAETVELGSLENANHRTIRKLLVNSVLPTCQLQMGMTELKTGSVWNTMPPHTHDRRMEVYFYFEVPKDQAVCHYMGEPDETRHIWMTNDQAVISPSWSIHSGAGTSNYTFIWGMAGENLDYGDMDTVLPFKLK
jgi:4-deoxy-L-threo-5-hexosulose-uronate ketol-isomerase